MDTLNKLYIYSYIYFYIKILCIVLCISATSFSPWFTDRLVEPPCPRRPSLFSSCSSASVAFPPPRHPALQ